MRTERCVIILELVFREAKLSASHILEAHGINPRQPYTHEHCHVDGAEAHRYIQPPRPQAPQPKEPSHA